MSEDYLLRLIQSGQVDDTFQIWSVLGEKGTRKSIPILYNIVSNLNILYLTRHHACEALFRIARITNPKLKGMVQYSRRDKNGKPVTQEQAIIQLGIYIN